MKTKNRFKVLKGVLCGLVALALGQIVHATTVATATSWSPSSFQPARNNALAGRTTTIEDEGDRTGGHIAYIGDVNRNIGDLTDGAIAGSTSGYAICKDEVLSWTFDNPVDLTEFRFYTCWQDAGRSGVSVKSITYRTSSDGEWIEVPGAHANCCGTWSDDYTVPFAGGSTFYRLLTIKDSEDAVLAPRAVALKVVFDKQDNDWDGYQEVEVLRVIHPDEVELPAVVSSEESFATVKYLFNTSPTTLEEVYAYAADPEKIVYSPAAYGGIRKSKTISGYTANATGYFGGTLADFSNADNNFPGGYYEWGSPCYYAVSGSVSVVRSGVQTLAVCAHQGSIVRVRFADASDNLLWDETQTMTADGALLKTLDLAAADYSVVIDYYEGNSGRFLEFASANGTVSSLNLLDFSLVNLPQYKITFDTGAGSAVNMQIVQKGGKVALPTAPVLEGSEFVRWLKDGEPYDFATPVTEGFTLTAEWSSNLRPVIDMLTKTPEAPIYGHWQGEAVLSVRVTDPDGDALTYAWATEGDQPGEVQIASSDAATTKVTVSRPGTYLFRLTASDGQLDASETLAVTFAVDSTSTYAAFAGVEYSTASAWEQKTIPDDPSYAWGTQNTGYKGAFRSTGTSPKAFLLPKPKDRANAYGMDGYFMPQESESDLITTGTYDAETKTVADVTRYIRLMDISFGGFTGANTPADDPRLPIGEQVDDFVLGSYTVWQNHVWTKVTTFTFGPRVAAHKHIRIGFASCLGDNWKPRKLRVNGVEGVWDDVSRGTYGAPDWMFFDLFNAQPGDVIEVEGYVDNNWGVRIDGIVFDSVETRGMMIIIN